MSFFELIGLVIATFAVIGAVAWLVFRLELRREGEVFRKGSHHDSALGKDGRFTETAIHGDD